MSGPKQRMACKFGAEEIVRRDAIKTHRGVVAIDRDHLVGAVQEMCGDASSQVSPTLFCWWGNQSLKASRFPKSPQAVISIRRRQRRRFI